MYTRRTFIEDVEAERMRNRAANGLDDRLEDGRTKGQLAQAAAAFAVPGPLPATSDWADEKRMMSRRRQLVVAAAYCMAEVERLERAEGFSH